MIRSQREKSPRPRPGAATIFGATPKGWFGGEAPPWVGELEGAGLCPAPSWGEFERGGLPPFHQTCRAVDPLDMSSWTGER